MANLRVIALAAGNTGKLKTVNLVASAPADDKHRVKAYTQVTSVQAAANPTKFQTVMDSGGTVKGLQTIFVNGYSGPS